MKSVTKIITALLGGLILLSSCKDKTTDSPFGEILDNPPYAGLTDSIKREPQNEELYFRRGVLLNTNNLSEPALADFRKAWLLKKYEKYAFGLGNLLLEKNPDSAFIFLNDALKILPESFLLQLTLAQSLYKQNKITEALNACNKILQENPEQVDVLKMKADILRTLGNTEDAINTLKKAYNLAPFDVELNYMYAWQLSEAKNSQVLSLCDSLIKADSLDSHAQPYYYKGLYYSNIGEQVKAIAFFDNAIRADHNFLESYIEKGSLLYDMKKHPEALAVFNLCLTISPKFADAYYWIAKCQEAIGQKDEAKLNYQRAYSLDKKLIEAKEGADKLK